MDREPVDQPVLIGVDLETELRLPQAKRADHHVRRAGTALDQPILGTRGHGHAVTSPARRKRARKTMLWRSGAAPTVTMAASIDATESRGTLGH
jgi:hypothetical protein